jgi:hypothetical protein
MSVLLGKNKAAAPFKERLQIGRQLIGLLLDRYPDGVDTAVHQSGLQ